MVSLLRLLLTFGEAAAVALVAWGEGFSTLGGVAVFSSTFSATTAGVFSTGAFSGVFTSGFTSAGLLSATTFAGLSFTISGLTGDAVAGLGGVDGTGATVVWLVGGATAGVATAGVGVGVGCVAGGAGVGTLGVETAGGGVGVGRVAVTGAGAEILIFIF